MVLGLLKMIMKKNKKEAQWEEVQQEEACCNSCKILPETLKLQKRLNWAQIHLSKANCRG